MQTDNSIAVALSIRNYYAYLSLIGTSLFKLTDGERMCLAKFMELKYDFNELDPFSTSNKKKVEESMKFKANTINVYIKKLKDKKAIIKADYGYDFNPYLKPSTELTFQLNWQ